MALSTQPYRGARDFYPEDKRLQRAVFAGWRSAVEAFGYEEYDAPLLEPLELYAAKSGDEIVSEQTYSFSDRGGRQVAIRPEMTPSVARMVAARRHQLAMPLRWYSIPNLWRYERPQRGRLREHWQLNVDLFGIAGPDAEFEMVQLMDSVMRKFKAPRQAYRLRLGHRQLTRLLLEQELALEPTQAQTITRLIDRSAKLPPAEFAALVEAVLSPSQRQGDLPSRLQALLSVKELEQLPPRLRQSPAARQLTELLSALKSVGISNADFDIRLVRGFDYYSGTVFEVFDSHPDNRRSIFGGGRYDGLVGLFGCEDLPVIGFGAGDAPFINFLTSHNLLPLTSSPTDLYIILAGVEPAAVQVPLLELRRMGLKLAVDSGGRALDKQIKAALAKGIRHALFIGPAELASRRYRLRDLAAGQEMECSPERIVAAVLDHRRRPTEQELM